MAKLSRADMLRTALELLNEEGLDALTTRRLAGRLGVRSPALYWHFASKAELFAALASEILATRHVLPIPADPGDWRSWFAENARSFRRSLLAYRDGARLHAGTRPSHAELERLALKVAYMEKAGFTQRHALMALYASSQFTLGSVLEEQARADVHTVDDELEKAGEAAPGWLARSIDEETRSGAEAAFEFGLMLLIEGLRTQQAEAKRS